MTPDDICANLNTVKSRIEKAATEADRKAENISLIAVSKMFSADHIRPALLAGHRLFGENRVQEAAAKWPRLTDEFDGIELHLIGPLQTNKVEEAVANFDVIQSVDRPKLAAKLAVAMDKLDKRPDCLVQVNTGEEEQKAGVSPQEVEAFVMQCREEFGLSVTGLMCIPPATEYPAPHFALLHKFAQDLSLPIISMGMSSDYEMACQLGATHIRVGSAIFGQRPPL
ncbi:MAG: YggS family pyridoxal phosphate-dependent enzyme [Aquisalinus sp.]|nr:YggS family pyridoxal phosphate-dependent enzyme [Aquisalinus sp.]